MNHKRVAKLGISLIEILVVMTVFAVLGILVSQAVLLTLRGARKSESLVKTRENLNYALAVMERQLRNAQSISPCPNPDPRVINYLDTQSAATSFSCQSLGSSGYIASGSARLTSTDIAVTACSITCSVDQGALSRVDISVTAKEATNTGAETAEVTSQTRILLRTY